MSSLPVAFAEAAPTRRRRGRASLARGLAASLTATLLAACAFAVAIEVAGSWPAGDAAQRTSRAQQAVQAAETRP